MHSRTIDARWWARRPARFVLLLSVWAVAACGGGADAEPEAAAAPPRAGTVWELDRAADRTTAPAALAAFVNGLDVMVVDGNDLYTGTTHRTAASQGNDIRLVKLANGLSAELIPSGGALELRFSNGDSVPLRKRTIPESRGR